MHNNTDSEQPVGITANIVNIHWSNPRKNSLSELPSEMSLTIPNGVVEGAKKKKASIDDEIENFCCNILTNKFGAEVHDCQIFLDN